MLKDTKSLGNNKAPACESRGFVRKIMKVCILTHLLHYLPSLTFVLTYANRPLHQHYPLRQILHQQNAVNIIVAKSLPHNRASTPKAFIIRR